MPLQPIIPPPNRHKHEVLLLLLPSPKWMPNRNHMLMRGRVEVSQPSRELLACAGGSRLCVLSVLACLLCVFDLYPLSYDISTGVVAILILGFSRFG